MAEFTDSAVGLGEGSLGDEESHWGYEQEEPESWDQLHLNEEGGEDHQDQEQVQREQHAPERQTREVGTASSEKVTDVLEEGEEKES